MIGRADIEESKSDVAMNAWPPQASYPCGLALWCAARFLDPVTTAIDREPLNFSYPPGNFALILSYPLGNLALFTRRVIYKLYSITLQQTGFEFLFTRRVTWL
ncbi:MAG: hypothetical protein EZS28_046142 [Streblomastix strix]|uniref:Uncharacterized protein n=1 Tax=Streblomastix strix TaxID=222440 RepID=A0A5J4TLD1_9EUKA|nr:MAG: hypothetical protein EZS28_046142 [Streblomastix strix]